MYYLLLLLLSLYFVLPPATRAADVAGQALQARRGPARGAVVFLESEHQTAPLSAVIVDQRDKMFLPHVTVITRGTTVSFPNHDTVLHNVFAHYNAKNSIWESTHVGPPNESPSIRPELSRCFAMFIPT